MDTKARPAQAGPSLPSFSSMAVGTPEEGPAQQLQGVKVGAAGIQVSPQAVGRTSLSLSSWELSRSGPHRNSGAGFNGGLVSISAGRKGGSERWVLLPAHWALGWRKWLAGLHLWHLTVLSQAESPSEPGRELEKWVRGRGWEAPTYLAEEKRAGQQ